MITALHNLFLQSTGVSTDTRNILEGNIFFALKGDNFNGNSYAKNALDAGASYAVIDEQPEQEDPRLIVVEDVLKILQQLATYHRRYLKLPILALTGSNGKTTTKELIAAVLSKKFNTVATRGNLNNHIGVPLTLLRMTKDTEIGIVEMGANHLGEIKYLCNIAQPDYGYITNFGKAHLEGFGSEEGVIKGKSELYDFLREHNKLIFVNADDGQQMKQSHSDTIFKFGVAAASDFPVQFVEANPLVKLQFAELTVNSRLIGAYNATNIAAAMAIGRYFEVLDAQIKSAIESYVPSNNRSQIIEKKELTIILDAYNANPSSMKAALENLTQLRASKKIAILGDMFELGHAAIIEHQYIAEKAMALELEALILVGKNFARVTLTKTPRTLYKTFDSTESLLKSSIIKELKEGTILIKGSRGMALERIVDLL